MLPSIFYKHTKLQFLLTIKECPKCNKLETNVAGSLELRNGMARWEKMYMSETISRALHAHKHQRLGKGGKSHSTTKCKSTPFIIA